VVYDDELYKSMFTLLYFTKSVQKPPKVQNLVEIASSAVFRPAEAKVYRTRCNLHGREVYTKTGMGVGTHKN